MTSDAPGVKTVVLGGASFRVRGVSDDDPYFRSLGEGFEAEFGRFCEEFVRDEYVCLDLGANIGVKALELSTHVSSGRVVAVEGAPSVARVLAENVRASGRANIAVVAAAVTDADGEVSFEENSAWGHVGTSGVRVPAKRIATIVREQGLERLDFVKIDIEGGEFPVLREGFGLLEQWRPLLYVEFNSWTTLLAGHNPMEFAGWLFERYEHVSVVARGPGAEGLVRLPREGAKRLVHDNIVGGGVTDIVLTNDAARMRPCRRRAAERPSREGEEAKRRAAALLAENAGLAQQRDAARQEALMLGQRNAALLRENEELRGEIAALRRSTSWRVTAPMRALRRRWP